MIEYTQVRSVNGHQYRDVYEGEDNLIGFEVKTPHCDWTPIHICDRACDVDCKNAQELFDEVGIEY